MATITRYTCPCGWSCYGERIQMAMRLHAKRCDTVPLGNKNVPSDVNLTRRYYYSKNGGISLKQEKAYSGDIYYK